MIIGTQTIELSLDGYEKHLNCVPYEEIVENYNRIKDGLLALYGNGLITLEALEELEYPLLYFTMEELHKEGRK